MMKIRMILTKVASRELAEQAEMATTMVKMRTRKRRKKGTMHPRTFCVTADFRPVSVLSFWTNRSFVPVWAALV
jgi:hypothetical protein